MSTGYIVIPIRDEQLNDRQFAKFLDDQMVFFPETLPHGRFPTLVELREAINELGYSLQEAQEWFVTARDDYTEIWFPAENVQANDRIEVSFRRGDLIILDISQALAGRCGSLLVVSESGSAAVLVVPDELFPSSSLTQGPRDFVATISRRLPPMLERLADASRAETLFILSQIRQALQRTIEAHHLELLDLVPQGLPELRRLLNHEDAKARFLAFDLISTIRQNFYKDSELLRLSIKNEPDADTKVRMIQSIEPLLVGLWIGRSNEMEPRIKALLDFLLDLSDDSTEPAPVRLAAANLMARARPGLLTPAIRTVFIESLVQPEQYMLGGDWPYSIIEETLKSIEQLLLNHRIEILLASLPRMTEAQDAHEVLRALLDHTFFGGIRLTVMSSLPDTAIAERPQINEACFRDELPRDWLYPANPTKLRGAELLPIQRKVLETVLSLDIPWMVHSNLLEKYGLPPTRALVRAMLDKGQ